MDSSLDNNGKPIKCETCGSSEEVDGDFVVYQSSGTSRTYIKGTQQITESITNYINIKHFSFGVCIECTRTKLLADIKSWKRINYILLYTSLAGIIGIIGANYFPNMSTGRLISAILIASGVFAFAAWLFSGYEARKEGEDILKGFPSDRAKVSKAILKYSEKKVIRHAHNLNPTVYINIKEDSYWFGNRTYSVVSKDEWETKISPSKNKISNDTQKSQGN